MDGLGKVAVSQSTYRHLLREPVGAGGPTIEEEKIQGASKDYGEDIVVATAIAVEYAIPHGGDKQPKHCLREAVAILDHLDTLGMVVKKK